MELDPFNAAARAGIKAIADAYETRAHQSLAREDPLAASLELVEAGLAIMPDHQGLRALRGQINKRLGQTETH